MAQCGGVLVEQGHHQLPTPLVVVQPGQILPVELAPIDLGLIDVGVGGIVQRLNRSIVITTTMVT
jgi:hypothetical protein